MDPGRPLPTPQQVNGRKPSITKYRTAVDFKALLSDLSRSGHGIESIAMQANLPVYLLRDYCLAGRAMLHEHGERLVELWAEISGKPRELAPRREGYGR
jgi:hypothetical protein